MPPKLEWMVNDAYMDKEDVATNKAIEYNNHDIGNDMEDNDGRGGSSNSNSNGAGNLYCKVATKEKKMKRTKAKKTTMKMAKHN